MQLSLKYDKSNGTLHEDSCIFMIISRSVLLKMKNVSDKTKAKYTFYIQKGFSEKRAVYEIIWKKYTSQTVHR